MKVGVIGVGGMGAPMAVNLARAGHDVFAYDNSAERRRNPELECTTVCSDVGSVARSAELVLTMTPDDAALLDVANNVAAEPADGRAVAIFVDISSTSLEATRSADAILSAAKIAFLDAAVYGLGVKGAREGRSPIVISGPRAAYDRIAAVIAPLGTIDYLGELGRAKVLKILNNLLVGAFCVAAGEIVSIGIAAGLPLEKIVESLSEGSGSSYILKQYYTSYLRSGSFGLGLIPITYMIKDLTLACQLAQEVGSAATLTELSRQIYQAAENTVGDLPFPEVFAFYNRVNGVALSGESS
jgi:3-hydroxyisobutyrate dehydrogenase